MRRMAGVVGGFCLLLALTACSGQGDGLPIHGPLVVTSAQKNMCIPRNGQSRFTLGTEVLDNRSDHPVVIKRIQLMDMRGFTDFRPMVAFMGENEDDGHVVGNHRGFPLHLPPGPARDLWGERDASIGNPLSPTPRANAYNLVVGIILPRPGNASFDHIQFIYETAGGERYLLNDRSGYRFAAGDHC